MKPLESLPVTVVVRLCTNNEKTVNYWNTIDSQLEVDLEILDDIFGEDDEVAANNPWLVYSESLQQVRMLGGYKELDLLDEQLLSVDQMFTVISLILYGVATVPTLAHPRHHWPEFFSAISTRLQQLPSIWCPATMQRRPLINLPLLAAAYSTYSGTAVFPLPRSSNGMGTTAVTPWSKISPDAKALLILACALLFYWFFFRSSSSDVSATNAYKAYKATSRRN